MVNCKLMIIVLVGVLEVYTANPISSEGENIVSNPYTAEELKRAKNVGISERFLDGEMAKGFTVDEIIKISQLINTSNKWTFEYMNKACEILVSGHKMTSNYTAAQADDLDALTNLVEYLPSEQHLPFIRIQICGFVSEPHSYSFGPRFFSIMTTRFNEATARSKNTSDNVLAAERMCCIDEGADIVQTLTTQLCDEDIIEFKQLWNDFDSLNVPKSIKDLCDFLHSRNLANRCVKASIPIVDNEVVNSLKNT